MTASIDTVLIAISIESIEPAPRYSGLPEQPYKAFVRGKSKERDANFGLQLNPMIGEAKQRCLELHAHGFTVVEVPKDWRYVYRNKAEGWQIAVIELALKRVKDIYAGKQGMDTVAGYDEKLAEVILEIVDSAFPNTVDSTQIKHRLTDEPSDAVLLTTLDALLQLGLISGRPLWQNTSGQRKLDALASIQVTPLGHQRAAGQTQSIGSAPAINQFINLGHAGAMGPNATGTINYQQQWGAIQNQVDLNTLAIELERLKKHIQQIASSNTDFQELGFLAHAEEHAKKHDGSKAMEVLSKVGTGLIGAAKEIGTEVAAKVIAKSLGIEP